eukprot:2494358-Rhodomonas_salina.2
MARTDDGEQAEEPWPETEKGRADAREDAKGLQSNHPFQLAHGNLRTAAKTASLLSCFVSLAKQVGRMDGWKSDRVCSLNSFYSPGHARQIVGIPETGSASFAVPGRKWFFSFRRGTRRLLPRPLFSAAPPLALPDGCCA